jgi:hypothetical protein
MDPLSPTRERARVRGPLTHCRYSLSPCAHEGKSVKEKKIGHAVEGRDAVHAAPPLFTFSEEGEIAMISFDLEAIKRLHYIPKCGQCKAGNSCCNGLDVEITYEESQAILQHLEEILEMNDYVAGIYGKEPLFTKINPNMVKIKQKSDGDCCFLLRTPAGCSCVIHQLEAELGQTGIKPQVCKLWPLYVEPRNGGDVLTVDEQCYNYICSCEMSNDNAPDYSSIVDIVEGWFGKEKAEALRKQLAADE